MLQHYIPSFLCIDINILPRNEIWICNWHVMPVEVWNQNWLETFHHNSIILKSFCLVSLSQWFIFNNYNFQNWCYIMKSFWHYLMVLMGFTFSTSWRHYNHMYEVRILRRWIAKKERMRYLLVQYLMTLFKLTKLVLIVFCT